MTSPSVEHAGARLPRGRAGLCIGLLALSASFAALQAQADAILHSEARFASTIAEYYIESGRLRLELEIGVHDLPAFRNLLPDRIYARLGYPERPFVERLDDFFERDFVIRVEDGPALSGSIIELHAGPQERRDEITGELLTAVEAPPETVITVSLEYPLPERPESITLGGPALAPLPNVGFVAYHSGIAVNDVSYLMPAQVLTLDWNDPWYSAFDARALRRALFAPMASFVYVEPREVRKEIIVRPKDLQDWVDLGLDGRATIPVDAQPGVMSKAADFLRTRQPVLIDGIAIEPELARVNFLQRTLRTIGVVEPPTDLNIDAALLGVIFVYPTDGLPERVTMEWDLFNERIPVIPAAAVDQSGTLPTLLEPDYALLEWRNFLNSPELPVLTDVPRPPPLLVRWLASVRWLVLPGAVILTLWLLRPRRRREIGPAQSISAAIFVCGVGILSFGIGAFGVLSDDKAGEVAAGLLYNIYRSVDYRDDGQIRATLESSVAGDLLEQVYLHTRQALELSNQDGARARETGIELVELHARAAQDGAFVADTTWIVHGSVGHWGHRHARSNRYRAELLIAPVDGAWKLAGLEILGEQRL